MATNTEISNLAISHLGISKEIANLDTEKSNEAAACRRFLPIAIEETLKAFAWPFATKFVALALVEENPTAEWAFAYQYPSDCLEFRRIISGIRNDNRQSRVPYRIVYGDKGTLIYTDKDLAEAEYTVRITDTSRFSSLFLIALSFRVAAFVAPRLTAGDPYKLGQAAMQNFVITISQAKAQAANEEQQEQEPDSEFIRARDAGFDSSLFCRNGR